jgi:hypothetical protein
MFYFKGTLVEAQQDLIDAWVQLVDAEADGKITHAQFQQLAAKIGDPLALQFKDPTTGQMVTFTQEYAQSINAQLTSDADFKENLRNAWREAAIASYNQVVDDLNALTG